MRHNESRLNIETRVVKLVAIEISDELHPNDTRRTDVHHRINAPLLLHKFLCPTIGLDPTVLPCFSHPLFRKFKKRANLKLKRLLNR